MPFKSKSQMRKCYAMKDPKWDCDTWRAHTPNVDTLPIKSGKSKTKMNRS
jgi:hypothetical protein